MWNRHRDAFSSFHTSSSAHPPPPTPLSTSKQFVGNDQKLVQTRESWKIQRKGNNVLAGKRKRVLVRKNETPSHFVVNPYGCNNIISVSDSSVHIVADFPHCSIKTEVLLTNSLLNSIRSELLTFSLLLWNEIRGQGTPWIIHDLLEVITITHCAGNLYRLQWAVKYARDFMKIDVPRF